MGAAKGPKKGDAHGEFHKNGTAIINYDDTVPEKDPQEEARNMGAAKGPKKGDAHGEFHKNGTAITNYDDAIPDKDP